MWWRLFNLVVAMWRVAVALICVAAVLGGNWLAALYGLAEVFGGGLSVVNAIKGRAGDWTPRGFAVSVLYLVGVFVLPAAGGPPGALLIGFEVGVVGLLFYTRWVAWTTYTSGVPCWVGLVDRGPYRLVRHPQAAVAVLARWGFVAGNVCAWNVATGVVFTAAAVLSALLEESYLRRFADWRQYARRVRRRFVPGVNCDSE